MTTGRINQVACRADGDTRDTMYRTRPRDPQRHRPNEHGPARECDAPPFNKKEDAPLRAQTRSSAAARACAVLLCSSDARPTRVHHTHRSHAAANPQSSTIARRRPRQTERPLRPAEHSLATRGAQRLPMPAHHARRRLRSPRAHGLRQAHATIDPASTRTTRSKAQMGR